MIYKRFAAAALFLVLAACVQDETEPQASSAEKPFAPLTQFRFQSVSPDPVAHGKRLSAVLGCIGCHTPDLTGEDWSDPELGVLWAANLTHSAAEYSESELISMIVQGKRADRALIDMPSYLFSELHPDDLTALVSYLKSLPVTGVKHPDATIGPKLAEDMANGDFKDSAQWVLDMKVEAPPDLGPNHAFARFILRATCTECHGMDLNGNTEQLMDAPPRPSLRMVAAFSPDDFTKLMRTGKGLGDRDLELMGGVSRHRYSQLTDDEVTAIYQYFLELAKTAP